MKAEALTIKERVLRGCLRLAQREQGLSDLVRRLREIVPDIAGQESSEERRFNPYWELKRRGLQAFQCREMLAAVESLGAGSPRGITVVDIGDSAGTHLLYLKALLGPDRPVETVSVNLDPRAIAKIRARGLKALLCRAEDLRLENPVDLFVSFEMLEHLHNPALFLRRLACRDDASRLLLTVPYRRQSQVGLHHVRRNEAKTVHAEEEHIFELSPRDWTLLFKHAGWRAVRSSTYVQYPRRWNPFWPLLAWWWNRRDFEGFWSVQLERDRSLSDGYVDWESPGETPRG
ncbi:MAG: methyltransferase domain-containing protein [Elusimicrobia bacterium]|nr:methyltransferase domain-containing protein [Elusimicrobiota bacterium]